MSSPQMPCIPLQRPSLGDEEVQAVKAVFDSRWLGLGSVVKEFEDRVRDLVGAKHVIAVNTGTSAIHIALEALGIGPGDEVLAPSLTFVATIQAVIQAGATPVFCDVEADTLNLDVEDARKRITPRTRAIIAVHYGGLACDLDALMALCKERGLLLVEDAAHAFGSKYKGRHVGSFGAATCFSFDPIKNITCGEGGAVCTEDDTVAGRIRTKIILGIEKETWRRYKGQRGWFYEVTTPGYRYHMSNINAAIGLCQLKKLDAFMDKKRRYVRMYDQALDGLPGVTLLRKNYEETAPFFYVMRTKERDTFTEAMRARGVDVGVHYIPNHLQPLFAKPAVCLPVTDVVWKEIVTLPLYCDMTDEIFETVVARVKDALGAGTGAADRPPTGTGATHAGR
jgi:dTDP-4-amino-4,6-dideoxygalactose transaminase